MEEYSIELRNIILRQTVSVISSKHCLCLQLELRPTGTAVRLKHPDYLGLKTLTLPDHSLKNARWEWYM